MELPTLGSVPCVPVASGPFPTHLPLHSVWWLPSSAGWLVTAPWAVSHGSYTFSGVGIY